MVLQDHSLMLRNTPISYISRICTASGNWFTLSNPTATVANVSTTATSLILTSIRAGVQTTHALLLADSPTLSTLATAVNAFSGDGWQATVAAGGFGSYPSGDIVPNQFGSATGSMIVASWSERTAAVRFDPLTGIVPGWGGSYDTGYQAPYYPISGTLTGSLIRGDMVRVVYLHGGFDPIPEDIKEVLSHLVISAFQSPEEAGLQQETIGNSYSYSLMDLDENARFGSERYWGCIVGGWCKCVTPEP